MLKVRRIVLRFPAAASDSSSRGVVPGVVPPMDQVLLLFCEGYKSLGGSSHALQPKLPALRAALETEVGDPSREEVQQDIAALLEKLAKGKSKAAVSLSGSTALFLPQTTDRRLELRLDGSAEPSAWVVTVNLEERPAFDAISTLLEQLREWGFEYRSGSQELVVENLRVRLQLELTEV